MKLLYINDELGTSDGSNYHAIGMLRSFERILGKENVRSFPQAEDGSGKPINHVTNGLRQKLKGPLQLIRYYRKKVLSSKRSKYIICEMKTSGFIPSHVIARSTVFDTTAIKVANAFGAKLIYEFNTPEFYERGVIKKEPLIGAIEKWEKRVLLNSDFVYINSNICRDMLCNHYGLEKEKFIVIPNGFMSELYTESDNKKEKIRNEIRKQEKIDEKIVVCFVGSLKIWHGIGLLCDIAELMEKDDRFLFLILGDGEMHNLIANYVSSHKNMIFKGKVNLETMKEYLYAPLKMFDMIGAGLPFVGTSIGQIKEFCEEKLDERFLIEDISSESISDQILNLMDDLGSMQQKVKTIRDNESWINRSQCLLKSISN